MSRRWTLLLEGGVKNAPATLYRIPYSFITTFPKTGNMSRRLAQIALVVDDYDRAIDFYTKKLGFTLLEDTKISETKRWVVVAPGGNKQNCSLLLARAANAAQESRIGNQTGGRVFLFLKTDNFWSDYKKYSENGVEFVGEPRT